MRCAQIHEAVKEAYRRLEDLTGEPAVRYIVEPSAFCGSTVYQWSEAVVIPKTLNKFNEFVQAYADAFSDGSVDKRDVARIGKEGGELIAAALGMMEEAARRERAQA